MNHASQLDRLQKKAQARYRVMFILTALLFVVFAVLLGRYGFGTDADPLFKRIPARICRSASNNCRIIKKASSERIVSP